MKKLLLAVTLTAVAVTACGNSDGPQPGDQPSGTQTTQQDDGGY